MAYNRTKKLTDEAYSQDWTTTPRQDIDGSIQECYDMLNSTTVDSSGADNVGASPVASGSGSTVMAILKWLWTKIQGVYTKTETDNLLAGKSAVGHTHDDRYFTEAELSATTDGASGADKVGVTTIPTLAGNTVQSVLESAKARFDDIALTNVDVEVANTHNGADGRTYSSQSQRFDGIDTQLSENVIDVSIMSFPRLSPETSDSGRLQRAIDYCYNNRGGVVRLDNQTLFLSQTVLLKQKVSLKGISIDNNSDDYIADENLRERGSCIFQNPDFVGDCLIQQVAVNSDGVIQPNDSRYQPQFVENIFFKGDGTKKDIAGLRETQTRLFIDKCMFWGFAQAIVLDSFANFVMNCDIMYCITGIVINNYENVIDNVSASCYKNCIELNGDFNKIINCKLMGDTIDSNGIYTAGSLYGIYVRGSRNIISNNVIDQMKHVGIYIDTSLLNHFVEAPNYAYTGPYGNEITNNIIFTNGHVTYHDDGSPGDDPNSTIGFSAGIVLNVVSNANIASPTIHRNIISNNLIETSEFKGWTHAGTGLRATKVGIHIVGKVSGDVFDNIINNNQFDPKITVPMLWYNANKLMNTISGNVNDQNYFSTDTISSLPSPSSSYKGKTLLMLPDPNYRDRLMFCGKDTSNNYLWRELCRALNGIGNLTQNVFTSGSVYTQDITVTGCLLNDYALASVSVSAYSLIIHANVISNGSVRVVIYNPTGSTITLDNSSQIYIRVKTISW